MVAKKTIVIIGGGIFGISAANRFAKYRNYDVKLITLSKYTAFNPGTVRVAATNKTKNVTIPLSQVIDRRIEILYDEVIDFNESSVILKDNGFLQYNCLIVATGAKWTSPFGSTNQYGDNYVEYFEEQSELIKSAKNIVLIGGGFNNVELAGELLYYYKEEITKGLKTITIIQSADKLLPELPEQFSDKIRNKVTKYFIERTPINILLNTRATYHSDRVVLDTGEELEADVVFTSIGVVPSVPKNTIPDLSNRFGFIKVDETFKIQALPKAFAIGDVTDFQYKGLFNQAKWLNTLEHNVKCVIEGSKNFKRTSKELKPQIAIVSVGPNWGVGEVPFLGLKISVPVWLVVAAKSKSLYSYLINYFYKK